MKLMVAVDLDHEPQKVVERALPWAERLDATLHLRAVSSTGPLVQEGAGLAEDYARSKWEATQKAELHTLFELEAAIPEDRSGKSQILRGQPEATLLAASQEFDALVMGTRSLRGLERMWKGSVAEQVVRDAELPVIVVPLDSKPSDAAEDCLALVVPVDVADLDLSAATYAVAQLGRDAVDLYVVHVGTGPPTRDTAHEAIAQALGESGLRASIHVIDGTVSEAARELVTFVEVHQADAIAMTTHGRKGLDRFAHGSVAEHVVRFTDVPVLVVRSRAG